jgi:hypothetical protein
MNVPIKYLPYRLSTKDKNKQIKMLKKSRKLYKKKKYYTRKNVNSYKSKTSNHIINARNLYNIDSIIPSKKLSEATGCSIESLKKIVKKGQGAYYSSGSRPNQTAQSWGLARLASAITGGKSAAVDYNIIENGCNHSKPAFILAKKSRKINGYGKRRVPKTNI